MYTVYQINNEPKPIAITDFEPYEQISFLVKVVDSESAVFEICFTNDQEINNIHTLNFQQVQGKIQGIVSPANVETRYIVLKSPTPLDIVVILEKDDSRAVLPTAEPAKAELAKAGIKNKKDTPLPPSKQEQNKSSSQSFFKRYKKPLIYLFLFVILIIVFYFLYQYKLWPFSILSSSNPTSSTPVSVPAPAAAAAPPVSVPAPAAAAAPPVSIPAPAAPAPSLVSASTSAPVAAAPSSVSVPTPAAAAAPPISVPAGAGTASPPPVTTSQTNCNAIKGIMPKVVM